MNQYLLDGMLQELRHANTRPLAIYESGTTTYVIYPSTTLLQSTGETGYPILRITEPGVGQTALDNGFLLETNRINGSNGSIANVDLKIDATNTLLLLTDPTLIYN